MPPQTAPLSLNPRQIEAVEHNGGPLLVLAGAGSGKTRVLTQRVIRLIREDGVPPWRIFAVTFTNKAAREMKERVRRDLGPDANDLWISTFHSSCLRILRRHAETLGYGKNFAVYDTTDQQTLVRHIIQAKNLSDKTFRPQAILGHIDRAKNAGMTPGEFPAHGDYFLGKVRDIYADYQKELQRNQAMDFGDLILNVILLLRRRPDILEQYQNQFLHLLIDEYQDTNPVQYQLIGLLSAKTRSVFAVGDDDQSIYRFRGAEIKNILNFQRDCPEARVIRLEQNYRSTKHILAAANAVIRRNKTRLGKELWTDNDTGKTVALYAAQNEHDEANFVASGVYALKKEYSLSDMAVFYRTNAQSRALEDELRKSKIHYRIFGGMKFYERAEIKDTVAYLRLIVNRADGAALKRVINVPARGIGKTTLDKLDEAAGRLGIALWDLVSMPESPAATLGLNAGTVNKLKSFTALMGNLDSARREVSLPDFLPILFDKSGYWEMLNAEKTLEAEGRKENLKELVNVAEEFLQENKGTGIEEFLDRVSLASDADAADQNEPYLTLMTVHLSKGLEFPVVFVTGLEEKLLPHARSLDNKEDVEEERRLFYVAMTRARELLHISFTRERRVFGTPQYNLPSRFLEDLPSAHVTVMGETAPNTDVGFDNTHVSRRGFGPQRVERNETPSRIDHSYSQENNVLPCGARVRHSVFGDGTIKSFEGAGDSLKVTIKFGGGMVKKLSFKHARLEVVG